MTESETSTQEAENQEAEAKLLHLAELTVECPCICHNPTSVPQLAQVAICRDNICSCQGAGQVAKYRMLRPECPGHDLRDAPTFHGTRYAFAGGNECSCQGRRWLPVSREKAGTEIRKMDEFRDWLYQQLLHPPVSYKGGEHNMAVSTVIDLLCNDNPTIAALKKMEEKHGGR